MKLIGVIFGIATLMPSCDSKLSVKSAETRSNKKCAGLSVEECAAKEAKEDLTVTLASTSTDLTNLTSIPYTVTFQVPLRILNFPI